MKARLHPTPAMQKAIDAYAEAKIQGIQSHAQEAVMKERNDIRHPRHLSVPAGVLSGRSFFPHPETDSGCNDRPRC
jgi:hypothetical protein